MMTDFLIVVIKGLLELRTDLKLILMSASLDESVFSKYFDRSPVVQVPGRTFPVREVYLEEITRMVGFATSSYELESAEVTNLRLVAKLVHHIHTHTPIDSGAILVFLTGWDEQDEVSGYLVRMSEKSSHYSLAQIEGVEVFYTFVTYSVLFCFVHI